jgi:DnaJ homolog subfamily C member 11
LSGVVLNLNFERGSQQFIFPIHLSNEVIPSAIFYGTVTPLVVYFVVKRLVLDPYQKNKEEKYLHSFKYRI